MAARVALVALIQLVDAVVRQVHVPVAQVLCRIRISAHQFQAFTSYLQRTKLASKSTADLRYSYHILYCTHGNLGGTWHVFSCTKFR